ncbi:MAG TPA: MarR family transcriptional regulator [Actinopolymorphaceae bacterium]
MTHPDQPTPAPDLVDSSLWRPVWQLLGSLDRDIAEVYAEAGLADFRPRFTGPLIRLGRRGPMTIQQLADLAEVTHSAMSQTVTAMRAAGFVESAVGPDSRTRLVALTDRARSVVPFLEAEWRATEMALLELEAEVPYALSQAARDIGAALTGRPFAERLRSHLHVEPDSPAEPE